MACGDRSRVDLETKAMGDKAALWYGTFARVNVVAFESIEDDTRYLRASCFTASSARLVEEDVPDPASNTVAKSRHRVAIALLAQIHRQGCFYGRSSLQTHGPANVRLQWRPYWSENQRPALVLVLVYSRAGRSKLGTFLIHSLNPTLNAADRYEYENCTAKAAHPTAGNCIEPPRTLLEG